MCHDGGSAMTIHVHAPMDPPAVTAPNAGHDYGQINNRQWQARLRMRSHSGRSIRSASMDEVTMGEINIGSQLKDVNPVHQQDGEQF